MFRIADRRKKAIEEPVSTFIPGVVQLWFINKNTELIVRLQGDPDVFFKIRTNPDRVFKNVTNIKFDPIKIEKKIQVLEMSNEVLRVTFWEPVEIWLSPGVYRRVEVPTPDGVIR